MKAATLPSTPAAKKIPANTGEKTTNKFYDPQAGEAER